MERERLTLAATVLTSLVPLYCVKGESLFYENKLMQARDWIEVVYESHILHKTSSVENGSPHQSGAKALNGSDTLPLNIRLNQAT